MLSRLVIIVTCVCLIGVTIVPASSVPCCCKSHTGFMGPHGISAATADTGAASCARGMIKARSCCPDKLAQASCSQEVVKQECPRCRCIEQLQIVALSGYAAFETSVRLPAVTLAAATPFPMVDSIKTIGTGQEAGGHEIVISLQTCTLRC